MKLHFKYFLLFLLSFSSIALFAQDTEGDDDEEDSPPKHRVGDDGTKQYFVLSPRLNVNVPHAIANKAFRKSFVGVYEVSGGLDVFLYKGLFIGGTAKNGLLRITGNKIANYQADMEIDNLGGKIGGDFYLGERNRVIFSTAITVGQNWTHYYGLVAKDPSIGVTNTSFQATYCEPEVDLYFMVDDNFGVGATLSYSIFNHTFDPYELKLNDWAPFDKNPTGSTQYLSFGIGVYYGLWKKKIK